MAAVTALPPKIFRRKIILVTELFPPSIGGIQNYLAQLCDQLSPSDTVVVARDEIGAHEWDTQRPYRIARTRNSHYTYPRWRPTLTMLRSIAAEHQPDVIVCGKALFEGRAALALKHETGIPYIIMTHGTEIQTWMKGRKSKYDLVRVLQSASRVICINDDIKNLLRNIGVEERRIVKMYPGISFSRLREASKEDIVRVRESYAMLDGVHICTVCRLISRKGVDTVLRALPIIQRAIPDIQYHVVGDGPEKHSLVKLARELSIDNRTHFHGSVPDQDIVPMLSNCYVFIMTPRKEGCDMEGFGIVYIEAGAAGLPVIGSDTGGVRESIIHGETGILVPTDDPEKTAEAVIRLISHNDERVRLARNAKTRVWNDFHPSRRALLFRAVLEASAAERHIS